MVLEWTGGGWWCGVEERAAGVVFRPGLRLGITAAREVITDEPRLLQGLGIRFVIVSIVCFVWCSVV